MNQEKMLKEFMSDPLIIEKDYLAPEEVQSLKWRESNVKIVELFKLAIQQHSEGKSTQQISRNLNQNLNS